MEATCQPGQGRAGGASGEGIAGCQHCRDRHSARRFFTGDDGKNTSGNKTMMVVSVAGQIFGKG